MSNVRKNFAKRYHFLTDWINHIIYGKVFQNRTKGNPV